eukprot:6069066-Ditylum_brightwellii.AAC.1
MSSIWVASPYYGDISQSCVSVGLRDRRSAVSHEELSWKCNIGLKKAKDTLVSTTQTGVRMAVQPLAQRMRVDHLRLNRKQFSGTWHCHTVLSKVKSLLGNTCTNVFTQGKCIWAVPMGSRKDAGDSLKQFIDDAGVPECMVTDGVTEFVGKNTDFVHEARKMRMRLCDSEQGQHKQNHHAECEICILAMCWKHQMKKKGVPRLLWDLCLMYESELLTRMARGHSRRSDYEEVTGNTPDISQWIDFEFYDLVWW